MFQFAVDSGKNFQTKNLCLSENSNKKRKSSETKSLTTNRENLVVDAYCYP